MRFLLCAVIFLAGCAGKAYEIDPASGAMRVDDGRETSYSGDSYTSDVLRKDVTKSIQKIGKCNLIDQVDSSIASEKKDGKGNVTVAREIWKVRGCGKTVRYQVDLRATPKDGGTDFHVKVLP